MKPLEKSAKKETVSMILTVLLYAAGAASVPYVWLCGVIGGSKQVEQILGFLAKMLCSVLPIYLIFQFGFNDCFKLNLKKIKGTVFAIPAVLVALNNLPIIPLMSGDMSINAGFGEFIPFLLLCISIGVLEETCFRGCIFPLVAYKFSKDKKGLFWSIVVSSAIFGAMHLLNLLGGFSPAVFLQVGYSFLIGIICCFAFVVSGNLYLPILMHAIYDVGGFMTTEGVATGIIWTTPNVIWTAVSSVIFAVAIIIVFLKKDFTEIYGNLNLYRKPEENK